MAYKCGNLRITSEEEYLIFVDGGGYDGDYLIGTKEDLINLKADIEAMLKEREA